MPPLRIAIIGGTGLGEALGLESGKPTVVDTPFGKPSGPITVTQWHGIDILLLQRHGPGHIHPPSRVPYRANIFALKSLGVTHIVASGATGSLQPAIKPGELVLPDQVIDKTYKRESTFYENAAVHVEFAHPFCPVTRNWLMSAAEDVEGLTVHPRGTYICMEGPAFSSRAESLMHRAWGGDLIGMTIMPEAKLAREAEIAYAVVSLPTDYDSWMEEKRRATLRPDELIREIMGNLKKATEASVLLLKKALEDASILRNDPSPGHDALRLAIWTDKTKIPREEVERLRVLWGKYF